MRETIRRRRRRGVQFMDGKMFVHNPRLEKLRAAPKAHPLRARLAPGGDQWLAAQVDNLADSAVTGSVRLVDLQGLKVETAAEPITFAAGETEKFVTYAMVRTSSPEFAAADNAAHARADPCRSLKGTM